MQQNKLEQFKKSYSYERLVKEHKLDEYGVWQILAEDTNCDLGGSHYQSPLGFYEGTLETVIEYAVTLPTFFSWGRGGSIVSIHTPIKLTKESSTIRRRKEKELLELKAKVEELSKQLGV